MAKCPSCNVEIDHLKMYVMEENRYDIYNDGEGGLEVDSRGFIEGSESYRDYECPECNDIIFSDKGDRVIPEGAVEKLLGVV